MSTFTNGNVYIDFKIGKVIKEIDEYTKEYKRKYGRQVPGRIEKIYMIHQDLPEGECPSAVYIGKTRQDLLKRLAQHTDEVIKARNGEKEWTIKLVWMNRVLTNGFALKIRLLSSVPKPLVYSYESEWITYLRIRGFNVMNTDNKKYWNGKRKRAGNVRY